MATLNTATDTARLTGGDYTFKTTGALDIQMQIDSEGFATIEGGVYAASDGVMTLPDCQVKIVNMGANSLVLARSNG
jgi:hypothetical protein